MSKFDAITAWIATLGFQKIEGEKTWSRKFGHLTGVIHYQTFPGIGSSWSSIIVVDENVPNPGDRYDREFPAGGGHNAASAFKILGVHARSFLHFPQFEHLWPDLREIEALVYGYMTPSEDEALLSDLGFYTQGDGVSFKAEWVMPLMGTTKFTITRKAASDTAFHWYGALGKAKASGPDLRQVIRQCIGNLDHAKQVEIKKAEQQVARHQQRLAWLRHEVTLPLSAALTTFLAEKP